MKFFLSSVFDQYMVFQQKAWAHSSTCRVSFCGLCYAGLQNDTFDFNSEKSVIQLLQKLTQLFPSVLQNFTNWTCIIASHCFHTSFEKADSSTDCALKGVFVSFLYIWQLPWLVIVSITQFTI